MEETPIQKRQKHFLIIKIVSTKDSSASGAEHLIGAYWKEADLLWDSFLYQTCPQGKYLFTKSLLFSSSCESSSSPLKPQTPTHFPVSQEGIWASIAWPPLSVLSLQGWLPYVCNEISFSPVNHLMSISLLVQSMHLWGKKDPQFLAP